MCALPHAELPIRCLLIEAAAALDTPPRNAGTKCQTWAPPSLKPKTRSPPPPLQPPQHTHESALLLQFAVAAAANIASHLRRHRFPPPGRRVGERKPQEIESMPPRSLAAIPVNFTHFIADVYVQDRQILLLCLCACAREPASTAVPLHPCFCYFF